MFFAMFSRYQSIDTGILIFISDDQKTNNNNFCHWVYVRYGHSPGKTFKVG